MGQIHTVVQGEYLSKIAKAYGFATHEPIWNAPENKKLKNERGNPNVLFPGDQVFIPDAKQKDVVGGTGQLHPFRLRAEKVMLRIVLKDLKNRPLGDHEGSLTLEGDSKVFRTAADGLIERPIDEPRKIVKGLLLDRGRPEDRPPVERHIPLKVGHLDPETQLSGQIARLNNLGYDAGPVPDSPADETKKQDTIKSLRFRSAVEEFQCDFGLTVDGVCGPRTAAKLKEVHGS